MHASPYKILVASNISFMYSHATNKTHTWLNIIYRNLITDSAGGYVGTFLLQHPNTEPQMYKFRDKDFRDACCDDRLGNMNCNMFFQRRIIDSCADYEAPALGRYIAILYMQYNFYVCFVCYNRE